MNALFAFFNHLPLAEASPAVNPVMFQLLTMGLLIAGMWFLLIAPQRKKQKAHQTMLGALRSGDRVMTTGGIYGTITNVKDDRFIVRVAENTKLEISRTSVQGRVDSDDDQND
jgi:preprotein translocase subunit YajC